jgi:hypothetical protein
MSQCRRQAGYVLDVQQMEDEERKKPLSEKQRALYMKIVGSLIWISGVRGDILFAVMYLTWFTKQPCTHHQVMALYVLSYLYNTKHIPLVLGGNHPIRLYTYTDSSLGTGPKGRSISGQLSKLNPDAGSIHAKSQASTLVRLSSFESELEAATGAIKSLNKLATILAELGLAQHEPLLYSDNEAMVNFVKGEGMAKGVRHMELRMWFTREQYKQGKFVFEHMPGKEIPADKLTKLATREEHEKFRHQVLGLGLLSSSEGGSPADTAQLHQAHSLVNSCANSVAHESKGV